MQANMRRRSRILIDTGGVNPFNPAKMCASSPNISGSTAASSRCWCLRQASDSGGSGRHGARFRTAFGVRRILLTRIDAASAAMAVCITAAHERALCVLTHASNSSKVIGEFTHARPCDHAHGVAAALSEPAEGAHMNLICYNRGRTAPASLPLALCAGSSRALLHDYGTEEMRI